MALNSDKINHVIDLIINRLSGILVQSSKPSRDFFLMDVNNLIDIETHYVSMVLVSDNSENIQEFISLTRRWLDNKGLKVAEK